MKKGHQWYLVSRLLRGLGGSNASRLLDEPKWVHGKRAVVKPHGLLTAKALAQRICAYYRCPYEFHFELSEKAS